MGAPDAVAERRQAIASDFSPRMLFNIHAQAAERRQVQTTCKHLPSLRDSQRGQTTDLGLKSEAITCRCSATICFKSADDSQFDALIWSWTHLVQRSCSSWVRNFRPATFFQNRIQHVAYFTAQARFDFDGFVHHEVFVFRH